MTELYARCLDTFPEWLRTLAADAGELAKILSSTTMPEEVRRYVAGGLNYVFKSLDLIPDGIEDLGYLDDAFVVRVAASLALREVPAAGAPVLGRLAADTKLIAEVLEKDYVRLETYVKALTRTPARGRTVDEILRDAEVRSAFMHEIAGWAASYEMPSFTKDEKNIVRLKAFLGARLPA